MAIRIHFTDRGSLEFPDFEDGDRLDTLVAQLASALRANAKKPFGNVLEWLIGFEGYPDAFALHWDGFGCDLGVSARCAVDMQLVAGTLVATGDFVLVQP